MLSSGSFTSGRSALVAAILLLAPLASQAKPSISHLSPATGPTTGDFPLTIHGSWRDEGSMWPFGGWKAKAVLVGSRPCLIASQSRGAKVTCMMRPGMGGDHPVRVYFENGIRLESPQNFSYNRPSIHKVDGPPQLSILGDEIITVTGADFGITAAYVTFINTVVNTTNVPTLIQNHTTLTFLSPAFYPGSKAAITVVNTYLESEPVHLHYAPMAIADVSPNSGLDPRGGTAITITGSSFGPEKRKGRVIVGQSEPCTVVEWSNERIVCLMPEGEGLDVPLTVLFEKRKSRAFTSVSYATPDFTRSVEVGEDGRLEVPEDLTGGRRGTTVELQ